MTEPLALAAALTFAEGSSDKFHDSLLVGRHIVARFGRTHTTGQHTFHTFDTPEQAAAKYWGLLRSKASKGYRVASAAVLPIDRQTITAIDDAHGYPLETHLIRALHTATLDLQQHARNGVCRDQVQPDWADRTRSPRTPTEGRQVFLALTDPDCPDHTLLECALAAPTERFLWPMAITHPNCPDTARVVRALAANTY